MKYVVKLQLRKHVTTWGLKHFCYCWSLIKIAIIITETFIYSIIDGQGFDGITKKQIFTQGPWQQKLQIIFVLFSLSFVLQ
jgi:hypothetical protein